ncbi:hypothetical protein Tco_0047529 [Tanacetum coccineum]
MGGACRRGVGCRCGEGQMLFCTSGRDGWRDGRLDGWCKGWSLVRSGLVIVSVGLGCGGLGEVACLGFGACSGYWLGGRGWLGVSEKIVQIKSRIQAARDRQKSYGDVRRKPLKFQVGDKVMLKVSPWKVVIRFGKRGKLNPRYIRPFKIIAKVGTVAYRLELLEQLSRVHSTFHVSNLKKCLVDEPLAIPLDEIQVDDKLHFIKELVEIMDREVKRLKQSRIPIVKVRWNSSKGPEFTWEREDQM